jgi:hypothetical protein
MLSKRIANDIFRSPKRNVGNKKGIARRACLISIRLGPFLESSSTAGSGITARSRKVYIDGSIINGRFMHSLLRLNGISGVDKLDITKSAAPLASRH